MSRPHVRTAFMVVALAAAVAAGSGCTTREKVPGKWFAGRPVEEWLEAIGSPDAKVRRKAAEVLGNVGPADPRSVPALAKAVNDTDRRVRDAAIVGLSKMGPLAADAGDALEHASRDPDPAVRKRANAALARVKPPAHAAEASAR